MDRFSCQVLSMEFACVESRYHPSGSVVRVSWLPRIARRRCDLLRLFARRHEVSELTPGGAWKAASTVFHVRLPIAP